MTAACYLADRRGLNHGISLIAFSPITMMEAIKLNAYTRDIFLFCFFIQLHHHLILFTSDLFTC